jgi:hypothetical protein
VKEEKEENLTARVKKSRMTILSFLTPEIPVPDATRFTSSSPQELPQDINTSVCHWRSRCNRPK